VAGRIISKLAIPTGYSSASLRVRHPPPHPWRATPPGFDFVRKSGVSIDDRMATAMLQHRPRGQLARHHVGRAVANLLLPSDRRRCMVPMVPADQYEERNLVNSNFAQVHRDRDAGTQPSPYWPEDFKLLGTPPSPTSSPDCSRPDFTDTQPFDAGHYFFCLRRRGPPMARPFAEGATSSYPTTRRRFGGQ